MDNFQDAKNMAKCEFSIVTDPMNPDHHTLLQALWGAYAKGEERKKIKLRTTNPLHPQIEMQVTGIHHESGVQGMLIISGFVQLERNAKPLTASGFYDANKKEGWVNVGDK
jgi:hypothetical protein